jgi:hypothetical protein
MTPPFNANKKRWMSLCILTIGVALTQLSKTQEVSVKDETSSAKLFTGFMTVMVAICLSGFAGEEREREIRENKEVIISFISCDCLFIVILFIYDEYIVPSGVYFEKILKKSNSNVWLRNIQLGTGSPINFARIR